MGRNKIGLLNNPKYQDFTECLSYCPSTAGNVSPSVALSLLDVRSLHFPHIPTHHLTITPVLFLDSCCKEEIYGRAQRITAQRAEPIYCSKHHQLDNGTVLSIKMYPVEDFEASLQFMQVLSWAELVHLPSSEWLTWKVVDLFAKVLLFFSQ